MSRHTSPGWMRRLSLLVGVSTMFAVTLATAAHAITRDEVMTRAAAWTDIAVPYDQYSYYDGYRTDCSGYVSYCWATDISYNCESLNWVSHDISKDDLQPGDAILKDDWDGGSRHVVLFGGWTDETKSNYWCYEEEGYSFGYAIRRIVEYPYDWEASHFRPIRYDFIDDGPGPGDSIEVGEREDHSTDPLIVDAYNRNGSAAVIGSPTNYVHQWGPGNNGWIQDFGSDKAITHKTQHTYAVYIQGAIWDLYKMLSGPWSSLGWPVRYEGYFGPFPLGNGYYLENFELGYDGWISDAPFWGDVTHDGLVNPYDTYTPTMAAGETLLFQLKVKNYGQETWPAGYVKLRVKGDSAGAFQASDWSLGPEGEYLACSNAEDVPPQGSTVFSWHMQAPPTEGSYPVEVMLYSLDGQCYVPNVVNYTIAVGSPVLGIQVGELADHSIDQKFVDCYNRNNGASAIPAQWRDIGQPTSYVEPAGSECGSAGWVQHFGPDKAVLRKDKSYALAAYTYGSVWHLYTGLGGPCGPESNPIDWPYWRDPYDYPYPSNPAVTPPPDIVDHPIGPVYQSYMIQNFLDTVPYDGWICEAPFWGDKTHDGLVYPFDTYDPVMVAGQTERFRLLVKNYGQETWQPGYVLIRIKGTYAASFRAEDWWEPEGETPGTVLIAGSVNEAVPPQGIAMLEWNMKAPTTPGLYGPGNTDLTVMLYSLDGRCYVANVMHYHVTVVAATPGPDYAISELRRTDGSGERVQGDTIDLSWETRNQGTTSGSSPTTTTIYLSSDATIDTADVVLYEDTVPPLAAGASQARSATLTIPLGILPPGTVDHQYHIGAICDTANAVSEINEGNNVAGGARLVVTEGSAYALTIGATGAGSVSGAGLSPDPDNPAVWRGSFAPGTSVGLEATEASDHIWLGWKWDQDDPDRQTDVTVTRNKFVTANFGPIHIFSDVVDPYTWAEREIASCVYAGIVQGYTQDDPETPENEATYRPELSVARDQMAAYIARAMAGGDANVPPGPATATFEDVPNTGYGPDGTQPYWAYQYIEYCVGHGVVKGYDATHYRPDVVVSRDQLAVFVARSRGWVDIDDDMTTAPQVFPDVPAGFWAGTAIKACVDNGVVYGYGDGTYRPTVDVTRDLMAVYVQRAFQLPM